MTKVRRVNLVCRVCEVGFSVPLHRKDRKYCSRDCYFASIKYTYKTCGHCKEQFRTYPSAIKTREYCSYTCRSSSAAYKQQCSLAGIKRAEKHDYVGSSNPNWRGGTCEERHLAMSRKSYKEWRKAVYVRDGYKCVECGQKGTGKNLQADHIKPYSTHPSLRLELANGRTLCIDCHKETDTYGWKMFNTLRKKELV